MDEIGKGLITEGVRVETFDKDGKKVFSSVLRGQSKFTYTT
jgi:hypothetical protein